MNEKTLVEKGKRACVLVDSFTVILFRSFPRDDMKTDKRLPVIQAE